MPMNHHVNIEPTNNCQLKCKYCGDNKTRKTGYMEMDDYKKIMKMVNSFLPTPEIRLFLSGEPLLHPDIDKMAAIACFDGHPVLIHSNGVALDENMANGLIKVGKLFPNHISMSFSLDGATKAQYRALRGPFLEKVLKNLEYFTNLNNNTGNPINITIQTILPYPKPKSVPKYLKSLKGVRFHVRHPHNWDIDGSIKDSDHERYKIPCGFLEDSVAIYWNGDCPVCCADLNGRYIIGNILKEGLSSIVERLDGFREIQERREFCPPCEQCERYKRD